MRAGWCEARCSPPRSIALETPPATPYRPSGRPNSDRPKRPGAAQRSDRIREQDEARVSAGETSALITEGTKRGSPGRSGAAYSPSIGPRRCTGRTSHCHQWPGRIRGRPGGGRLSRPHYGIGYTRDRATGQMADNTTEITKASPRTRTRSHLQQLTANPTLDHSPACSADDRWVPFNSICSGSMSSVTCSPRGRGHSIGRGTPGSRSRATGSASSDSGGGHCLHGPPIQRLLACPVARGELPRTGSTRRSPRLAAARRLLVNTTRPDVPAATRSRPAQHGGSDKIEWPRLPGCHRPSLLDSYDPGDPGPDPTHGCRISDRLRRRSPSFDGRQGRSLALPRLDTPAPVTGDAHRQSGSITQRHYPCRCCVYNSGGDSYRSQRGGMPMHHRESMSRPRGW